jgi:hypothetical protein
MWNDDAADHQRLAGREAVRVMTQADALHVRGLSHWRKRVTSEPDDEQ